MSEKGNNNEPSKRYEFLDTSEHIITLADAILQQIGKTPPANQSQGKLARFATWRRNNAGSSYQLNRYDYDEQTQKYQFDILHKDEDVTSYVFRTRGHNHPKLYQVDVFDSEQELLGEDLRAAQDEIFSILMITDLRATIIAERQSIDREFEKVVGRYILSDLAARPLGIGESPDINPEVVNAEIKNHTDRTKALQRIALADSSNKKGVKDSDIDRAIKNIPDPTKNPIFIDIDPRFSAGIAAKELGSEWSNTYDIAADQSLIEAAAAILNPDVEKPKELVTLEAPTTPETPNEDEITDSDPE